MFVTALLPYGNSALYDSFLGYVLACEAKLSFRQLDLCTTIYYTVYLLQKAKHSRNLILISSNNITKSYINSMTVILSKTFIVLTLAHPVPGAVFGFGHNSRTPTNVQLNSHLLLKYE